MDLRPIAVMNVSHKIFMGIIKNKIEKHLEINDLTNELQSAIIIAINFTKAFDSVDRKKLIHLMKQCKIDAKIISITYEI